MWGVPANILVNRFPNEKREHTPLSTQDHHLTFM